MMTLLKDFGFKRTTAKPDYFITAYERAPIFILKVLSSKKLLVYEQKKALSKIAFITIFITTMNYISVISDLKNGGSATRIENTNLIFIFPVLKTEAVWHSKLVIKEIFSTREQLKISIPEFKRHH